MDVNLYLEDWSQGMRHSRDYVWNMMEAMKDRVSSASCLPILSASSIPDNSYDYITKMTDRYPGAKFEFHAHNDYDMAVGNSLWLLKRCFRYCMSLSMVLGERCGNAPLSSGSM
jgi:D-citramalate synthase